MVVYDFLIVDAQVLGKGILLGEDGQIAIFIGGVHLLKDGMEVPQTPYYLLDEFLMLDKV